MPNNAPRTSISHVKFALRSRVKSGSASTRKSGPHQELRMNPDQWNNVCAAETKPKRSAAFAAAKMVTGKNAPPQAIPHQSKLRTPSQPGLGTNSAKFFVQH